MHGHLYECKLQAFTIPFYTFIYIFIHIFIHSFIYSFIYNRQVLQSNKAVTLQDLLTYCRSVGISEELLKRYEAAAAVLLSPNRGALSGSHIGSGVGGCNSSSCATSTSFFSPSASLQRSSSGGFPSSSVNSTSTRTTAASFGKGWMSPAPVVEPFASSSSSVMGAGAATFSSSRRGRRY